MTNQNRRHLENIGLLSPPRPRPAAIAAGILEAALCLSILAMIGVFVVAMMAM